MASLRRNPGWRRAWHDSQIVQQPLPGQGTLSLDWPKIPRMEIELQAVIVCRCRARMASQRIVCNWRWMQRIWMSSRLGLAGGLVGQGVLVGDWRSPRLNLQLSAVALGWRDHFRLAGLKLALNGPPPAVPLNLDLSIARLDLPERPRYCSSFN